MREKIEGKMAIHSAAAGDAPEGLYGKQEQGSDRSKRIQYSECARATFLHPLIRRHADTRRESLYGCMGYVVSIDGMGPDKAITLSQEPYEWQTQPQFQYRHIWASDMLVMRDNCCTLQRATGGYEGHDRLLHRTTIGSC